MRSRHEGFTLVELLIVIAIIATVAVIAFVNLTGNHYETIVNTAGQQMVTLARQAQTDAASRLQNTTWGIHFANTTTTQSSYAIFSGSSYATTSVLGSYPLPAGVAYLPSTIATGTTLDVTFSPISGAASASTSVTIYSVVNPSIEWTISINLLGTINGGSGGGGTGGSSQQDVYITDFNNNRIEVFNTSGTYLQQISGCLSGGCASSTANGQFNGPSGIAVESNGAMWVTDENNTRFQELSSNGVYLDQLGCGGSGACSAVTTSLPGGNTTGAIFGSIFGSPNIDSSGNIWVPDASNGAIKEFGSSGNYILQFGCAAAGCFTNSTSSWLKNPNGVAVDATGTVWVVDTGNNRVQAFDAQGNYIKKFGCGITNTKCPTTAATGGFNNPEGIAIDASGNLWIVDTGNSRVEEFSGAGADLYLEDVGCASGCGVTGSGTLSSPTAIAIDANGNLWVTDSGHNRIEEYDVSGDPLAVFGCSKPNGCSGSSANGAFSDPSGIAIH